MEQYIATFHTHLSALMTSRALSAAGIVARMMPAPRKLSSSCGTCLRFDAEDAHLSDMDVDVERVYRIDGGERYTMLLENK